MSRARRSLARGVAVLAALLVLYLTWYAPMRASVPETVTWVDETYTWRWDGREHHREEVAFVFDVTLPDEPRFFHVIASLLSAETYNWIDPNPPHREYVLRQMHTWINISVNDEPVVHAKNFNDGGATYAHFDGVPSAFQKGYFKHLRKGPNEVRVDVTLEYATNSTAEVDVMPRVGPVRVLVLEADNDGDGVSDRYQLVPGILSILTALAVGAAAAGGVYAGVRRLPGTW